MLRRAQEAPNPKVVDGSTQQTSEQWCDDRDPPHAGSVGEAVVVKSGQHAEQTGTEVARRIDRLSVHAAKARADGHDDKANQRRREIGSRRCIVFINDRENQKHQQRGADGLVQKAGLWQTREGRKGRENAGGMLQLRISLVKRRHVIPKYERGRSKGSCSLSDTVGQHLAPRKSAKNRERQSYRGIEMCPGNFAGDVDAHHHPESPAQGDVGEAAVNGLSRVVRGKQHDHGNHSCAKQDEHKSAEELRDQLCCQGGLRVHSSPVAKVCGTALLNREVVYQGWRKLLTAEFAEKRRRERRANLLMFFSSQRPSRLFSVHSRG